MDERYSRLEKNKNLYIDNDDHKFVVFYYFIFLPIVLIVSFFLLLTDVHATESLDMTYSVTPGQECGVSNQSQYLGKMCYKYFGDYPSGTPRIYSINQEEIGTDVFWTSFYLNTSIDAYTNNTIKILGVNFKNVSYQCVSSYFTCNVVYVNSGRLNVNFVNNTSTARTGTEFAIYTNNGQSFNSNNTYKITNVTYLWNDIDTSSGGGSGGSGGSSYDDSGIINNQNENTQDIIQNNNENTTNIINTINQAINDTFRNCINNYLNYDNYSSLTTRYTITKNLANSSLVLKSNGNYSGGSFPVVYYLNLKSNTTYYFKSFHSWSPHNGNGRAMYYIYTGNVSSNGGTLFDYTDNDDNFSFTTGSETKYYLQLYITGNNQAQNDVYVWQMPAVYETNYTGNFIPYGQPMCDNVLQDVSNAQNETNDLIKDDSVDQSQANNFFTGFDDDDNGGISAIITRPLMIINTLLDNNASCSNLQLPNIMGSTNAYLPSGCILWDNAPSEVITLWNTLVIGLGSYFILRDLYKTIHDLKDPDNDKVEVMDL